MVARKFPRFSVTGFYQSFEKTFRWKTNATFALLFVEYRGLLYSGSNSQWNQCMSRVIQVFKLVIYAGKCSAVSDWEEWSAAIVPAFSVYNSCRENLASLQWQMTLVSNVLAVLEYAVACATAKGLLHTYTARCTKWDRVRWKPWTILSKVKVREKRQEERVKNRL